MDRKLERERSSALPAENDLLHSCFLGTSIALLWLIVPASGVAHSGFLDKNGCHNNNKKHVYECHKGLLKGQTYESQAEALTALEKKKKETGTPGKKSAATTPNAQTGVMKGQPPQQIPASRK